MKLTSSKFILACGAAVGLSFLASGEVKAQQGYYPTNQYGYQGSNNTFGQNITNLHQYGTQINQLYTHEARYRPGCRQTAALLSEVRNYNRCTNNLHTAYRGTCPTTFKRAAYDVRNCLTRVQRLRRNVQVSPNVCNLISRSCPMASYVHTNYSQFRPVVHRPVPSHGPVYRPTHRPTHGPTCNNRGGLDIGSAIFGAVAGRVIHGIVRGH